MSLFTPGTFKKCGRCKKQWSFDTAFLPIRHDPSLGEDRSNGVQQNMVFCPDCHKYYGIKLKLMKEMKSELAHQYMPNILCRYVSQLLSLYRRERSRSDGWGEPPLWRTSPAAGGSDQQQYCSCAERRYDLDLSAKACTVN